MASACLKGMAVMPPGKVGEKDPESMTWLVVTDTFSPTTERSWAESTFLIS